MNKAGKKVRKRVKEKPFLPDEIITNILIRLPVKSLVRFELVCRKWRDIILGRDFVDLHQRSSIPVILVCKTSGYDSELFAVDKWWDLSRTRSVIHRFPFDCAADFPDSRLIVLSHAGLIVLESLYSEPNFVVILNPARPSHEYVKINFPYLLRGDICAVYYHPSLKEYCSLWKIDTYSPNQLLILSSKPSLKRIHNPFEYRLKDYTNPLFINDHLYWMLECEHVDKFGGRNDILEFDIISEEFKVIPCPIPLNTECKRQQTHLLNSDGVISFVLILPSTITIWRLEDHVQQLWTSTEYTTSLKSYQDTYAFRIVAVVDGKLAFASRGRLFVCNLIEGTVKNYPRKYTGILVSHQMTSASLKNCRYELHIDKDGNLVV